MIHLLNAVKLLVFATILSLLSGSPIPCPKHKNIEVKIYCSNNLSDALDLICGGKYYSLSDKFPDTMGSSSSPSKLYQTLRKKQTPDDYYQPLSANGTIHECCRRPCGYTELKLYCANDSN